MVEHTTDPLLVPLATLITGGPVALMSCRTVAIESAMDPGEMLSSPLFADPIDTLFVRFALVGECAAVHFLSRRFRISAQRFFAVSC